MTSPLRDLDDWSKRHPDLSMALLLFAVVGAVAIAYWICLQLVSR